MMTTNQITNDSTHAAPELRFPEFHDDWQVKRLGELTECVNLRNKEKRDLPIYSISNKDGFILQSEQFEGLDSKERGYDTSLYKIVKSNTFAYNPARINVGSIGYSGDIKECLVSSLYVCFKTKEELYDSFMSCIFETSMFKSAVNNNVEGGIRSYLFYENFTRIKICIPTLPEQRKITACLSSLDSLIKSVGEKIDLLKQHKKGLMQKLFPKRGSNAPELRFLEFSEDWEVKRLGEIAEKITKKNKGKKQLSVFTNSAADGVINQEDYFDREIITRDNSSNYQIIELNDFVYNPRISTIAPVGPISRNKIGEGIMSPLYTIFRFKEGDLNYLEHFFKTTVWHSYLKARANFGARFDRMNISNETLFEMPIPFPSLAEQRKIADCLSSIDKAIEETENKVRLLEQHKKGLMQRMFVKM